MPDRSDRRSSPDLPAGRRLALVVAINRYDDSELRQLRAPSGDAAELSEILSDPEIGGFAVTSVVNGNAQGVRLAVAEFVSDRNPGDLLLVYLSCHGLVDLRRRLYFAASDTLKHRLAATGVEAHWLLDQLEDCRASQQVVILDCCFSGAFARGAKGDSDLALGERFLGHGRGRVVLTASRGTEYSFEGEPLPGSAMPGSVFTQAVVTGIRTGAADADADGFISVDEAYSYAFDQVRAADAQQTPQRWLYGAEGSILLARNPVGIVVVPAALPEGLRAGLDNPHPSIRLGAVAALGEWLADDDPARVLAARDALARVVDNDVPRVAAAARALLEPTSGEPEAVHGGAARKAAAAGPAVEKGGVAGEADPTGGAEPTRPSVVPPAEGEATPAAEVARPGRRRPRLLFAGGAAAVLAVAGIVLAVVLRGNTDGEGGAQGSGGIGGEFTASAPWRLVVKEAVGPGCTITLTNTDTGERTPIPTAWSTLILQMHDSGRYRWESQDAGCIVVRRTGAGEARPPFLTPPQYQSGDSPAFEASAPVAVDVLNFNGNTQCQVEMRRVQDGLGLDVDTARKGVEERLLLDPGGRALVYIANLACTVRVSEG